MILDKLLEKKDLITYIDNRIKIIRHSLDSKNVLKFKPRNRYFFIIKTRAKISELKKLKQVINNNKLKELSKRYYKEVVK